MAKFFSLTVRRPRETIPNGNKIRIEYALRYDEFGNKYLAEVGSFDQYAYIQSFAASCDINEIVRRATPEQMAAFGKGIYGNVSNLPKTLADSYEILRNAESVYAGLPVDVKAQYADYNEFLNSFGTIQGVADFLGKFAKKKIESEVKPDEQKHEQ